MKLFAPNTEPGARSLQVFGLYLCATGLLLLLAPALVLAPLALPVPQDVWIRLVGILALALGFSDLRAAGSAASSLIRASVWRRTAAAAAILVLVFSGVAPPALALFAAIDIAAAAWTALALRQPAVAMALQA